MLVNLTKFKMGYGPMSHEIIDILARYSISQPLMVIASRNQVDYASGYVCSTAELGKKLRGIPGVLLCRDHCGPYFKDSDRDLDEGSAITECKKTIRADLANGFHLIHIDVSKTSSPFTVADELIKYALDINPGVLLEFGSEENTGQNLSGAWANLDRQLEYCRQYRNNIKFFVSQTGSYIKDRQLGAFDIHQNRAIADKIHASGFLFKEHNGDYLESGQILLRKEAGVDAINVAPQLGVVQSRVLMDVVDRDSAWRDFVQLVVDNGKWRRWLNRESFNDPLEAVEVAGHYHFGSLQYSRLNYDHGVFQSKLEEVITSTLDTYKIF